MRGRIARNDAGVHGDARPGDALHQRHGRAGVDVRVVPAFLADDAEHARRRAVPGLAGRYARARDAAGGVVDGDVLVGQRDDDIDRLLGPGLLGFLLGRSRSSSQPVARRPVRAPLVDDALAGRALVAEEIAEALLGGRWLRGGEKAGDEQGGDAGDQWRMVATVRAGMALRMRLGTACWLRNLHDLATLIAIPQRPIACADDLPSAPHIRRRVAPVSLALAVHRRPAAVNEFPSPETRKNRRSSRHWADGRLVRRATFWPGCVLSGRPATVSGPLAQQEECRAHERIRARQSLPHRRSGTGTADVDARVHRARRHDDGAHRAVDRHHVAGASRDRRSAGHRRRERSPDRHHQLHVRLRRGQLVYGRLSDRYGRKPVLMAGHGDLHRRLTGCGAGRRFHAGCLLPAPCRASVPRRRASLPLPSCAIATLGARWRA